MTESGFTVGMAGLSGINRHICNIFAVKRRTRFGFGPCVAFLCAAFTAFFCVTVPVSATELLGLRFGPDGDKTRIVFDLVGAPDFEISGDLEGQGRLIVTFNNMTTGPEGINGFAGKGLIERYAYAPDGRRQTRFVLRFKRTAKISQILTLDPSGSVKKHRLVIDLLASDGATFMASLPRAVTADVDRASPEPTREPIPASTSEATTVLPSEPKAVPTPAPPGDDTLGAFIARETGRNNAPVREVEVADGVERARKPSLLTNQAVSPEALRSAQAGASHVHYAGPDSPSLKPVARLDDRQRTIVASSDVPNIQGVVTPARSPVRLAPPSNTNSTSKRTIVLDPGHGGSHPGAVGLNGTYEKDVNLAAALVLADILRKTGRYRVLLTRSDDTKVELDQRAEIAHDNNAKLFLSLHADGNNNRALRGSSVYTLSDEGKKRSVQEARSQDNYKIADAEMSEFSPVLGSILFDVTQKEFDRESRIFADALLARLKGVTPLIKNAKRSEDLKVLLRPDLPAVLLEMAFISNAQDEANLIDPVWQTRTMSAVARAIDDYFEQSALSAQAIQARTGTSATPSVSGSFQ